MDIAPENLRKIFEWFAVGAAFIRASANDARPGPFRWIGVVLVTPFCTLVFLGGGFWFPGHDSERILHSGQSCRLARPLSLVGRTVQLWNGGPPKPQDCPV
ncbi:hypothetical protein B0T17DRAFT_512211 [Bombardia bombarda]|uniref:Uncharacterized protein n=1 Tax=Bombardia bombarda TaxID=252184 RepID=A0AA39TR05_9PEZI|nr:hypothetical protein B0T17DRAFT_512211 [Bombardia bombarda]